MNDPTEVDATLPEGAVAAPALDLERAYCRMLFIRLFELAVERLFREGKVHGTTHLCNGQEGVAVGVGEALRESDLIAATYRGHGHALARGLDPTALAGELMGRVGGISGGRGGSMNISDLGKGFMGSFGIVGGTMGAAVGAGVSLRGTGRVVAALFGDGAANQAYFAECLNFAKVLELPVVFICENNQYGEYTPWRSVTAGGDISSRVRALDIPAMQADGNDVSVVYREAAAAVGLAGDGQGPQFLEFSTYRLAGHSRSDPGEYRPPGELESWLERDPLKLARSLLAGRGVSREHLEKLDEETAAEVDATFSEALESPFPEPEEASEYATAD